MRRMVYVAAAVTVFVLVTACPSDPGSSTRPTFYNVTYDGNGATSGTAPEDNTAYERGATVTVADAGALAKSSYTFAGWNTQPDASGTDRAVSSTFAMGNSDVTLYAWWTNDTLTALDYVDLVSVPGGTYIQSDGSASFTHTVSSFDIGKYEVRYELWYEVYQWGTSNGYSFENAGREGYDGIDGANYTSDRYEPVTNVAWRDSIVWCNAYSEMTGYSPVYKNGSDTVIRDSTLANATEVDGAVADWTANGYRLPTEGEWQHAASYIDGSSWLAYNHASGDESSHCYPTDGGVSTVVDDYAVYSVTATAQVGSKTENHLAIFDMSGNVYEWCWDWYDTYPAGPEADYRGPAATTDRVRRGGGYIDDTYNLRVGSRPDLGPGHPIITGGLRVSRVP